MSDITRRSVLASAALTVVGASVLNAEEKPDAPKSQMAAGLKKLLDTKDVVQMRTVDGETDGSVTVSTGGPGGNTKDKDLAYVVPDGYVRYRADLTTSHNSGDSAQAGWANDDAYDGTIHLRAHCSGFNGAARAACSAAYAIKEEKAKQMAKENMKKK